MRLRLCERMLLKAWLTPLKSYLLLSDRVRAVGRLERRLIFSQTGQWEKTFSPTLAKDIEQHWQEVVNQKPSEDGQSKKEKFYVLSMFPYPSGQLHMGHVRVYSISDVMARFHRLNGKQVIHPMGWDGFGLPAENAARDRGVAPDQWTYSNIKHMKKQLKQLGCLFDWHREFATCDPDYYRWTQWIFIKMFESGLAYQKQAEVNWDPVDQTVLAEEQIDEEGRSWRSGAKVEKRFLRQWYLKTTVYAKSLLEGLECVDASMWRDIIKLQKNWLGDCTGSRFDFSLQHEGEEISESLSVFTPHPEAMFGATFIAMKSSHWLNQSKYYKNPDDVSSKKDALLNLQAVHPFTRQLIPVIVSSSRTFQENNDTYLGIACLNEEDKQLAGLFNLPITDVLRDSVEQQRITDSGEFSGLPRAEAAVAITEYARKHGFGGHMVSPNLNDWLISRQRYWGTPIPIIHCPKCQAVPVPEADLPVTLPDVSSFPGNTAKPLSEAEFWKQTSCPRCGGPAHRETDTMDTFVDSSWYFLRYLDPQNTKQPFDPEKANVHMPVDLYIGGKEHAVLHLYFARFFTHFLHDLGLVTQREPFKGLLTQGMVMGQSYQVKSTGKYLALDEVVIEGESVTEKGTGAPVVVQWEKMSKSKYNGVDPQDVLKEFGCDTTRLCILSNVAPKSDRHWSPQAFVGILNWQRKIWTLMNEYIEHCQHRGENSAEKTDLLKFEEDIFDSRNYHIKEVSFHLNTTYLLNTAISKLQSYTRDLRKDNYPMALKVQSTLYEQALADLIIVLSPFSPSFASELWSRLTSVPSLSSLYHWDKGVLEQNWPEVDLDYRLPFSVKVNHQTSLTLKLPRGQLEALTPETALDLIKGEHVYRDYIQPCEISSLVLNLKPSYSSELWITLPEKSGEPRKTLGKAKKKYKSKDKQSKSKDVISA
ncbi:probable leucine--tRNA ligase, mitochondrial [Liolophura sinensis]|uniref:probable leucine--tRNA ligase, mitochondrial n=1 Tax=Liolophura sinensis TaxID=3198878 RepID=UPI003158600C